MDNKENYAENIIKDLSILKSNKLNSNESIIYFSGIIYSIILNKKMFKKNEELKEFIYDVFLNPMGMKQYKEYLYKNRTLLGSRVSRHILDKFNYTDTIKLSKIISKYIKEKYDLDNNTKITKNYKNKKLADALSVWIKNEK